MTKKTINKLTIICFCVSALLISGGLIPAKETTKGMRLDLIKTEKEAEKLKPGAMMTMVCAKCKTVMVRHIMSKDTKGHTQWMHIGAEHQCPGCGGKIQVKRKSGKETEVVHVCTKCGDASAFCCATKPGEKTSGM